MLLEEAVEELFAGQQRESVLATLRSISDQQSRGDFAKARENCLTLAEKVRRSVESDSKFFLSRQINEIIYSIRGHFMTLDDNKLGNFVDATIERISPERTRVWGKGRDVSVPGKPVFHVRDQFGTTYACFVLNALYLCRGDFVKLHIVNRDSGKRVIYLEPRLEKGDKIVERVEENQRGSPNFHFMNYYGVVNTTKGMGVNNLNLASPYQLHIISVRRRIIFGQDRPLRIGKVLANALAQVSERTYEERKYRIERS